MITTSSQRKSLYLLIEILIGFLSNHQHRSLLSPGQTHQIPCLLNIQNVLSVHVYSLSHLSHHVARTDESSYANINIGIPGMDTLVSRVDTRVSNWTLSVQPQTSKVFEKKSMLMLIQRENSKIFFVTWLNNAPKSRLDTLVFTLDSSLSKLIGHMCVHTGITYVQAGHSFVNKRRPVVQLAK